MSAAAVTRPPTLPTNARALNHPYRRHTSDFESSSKRFHDAKKKALTAADTAYMTACKHDVKHLTAKARERGRGTSVAPSPSLAASSAESDWLSCEKHNLLNSSTVAL